MFRSKKSTTRKLLTIFSSALGIAVVVLILFSAFSINDSSLTITEKSPLAIKYEGTRLLITGEYELNSGLASDIGDLRAEIKVFDNNGSVVQIYELDTVTVTKSKKTLIVIDESIFAPSLLFVIVNVVKSVPSEMPIKMELSGKYVFGLSKFVVAIDAFVPLTSDGKRLGIVIDSANDRKSVTFENLKDELRPSDGEYHIISNDAVVKIDVSSKNEQTIITARSESNSGGELDLNIALERVKGSYSVGNPIVVNITTGEEHVIGANEMNILIFALENVESLL